MDYDIIIAGGGMVGSTLACLLAAGGKDHRKKYKIAVIESFQPQAFSPDAPYDLRVSAISRASQNALIRAGAWDTVTALRVSPYEAMDVWDATGDGEIRFDAAELGEPDLGHIIENRVVQLGLLEAIKGYDSIDLLCPNKLSGYVMDDAGVTVHLEDGSELTAHLLVGADGARSRVREIAGIDVQRNDYSQKGIVAVVTTELPHQRTAWQRFMPSGPLAFLPLADGSCSIVWTLPSDRADYLLFADEDIFKKMLAESLDHRLGDILTVSERAAFPFIGSQAKSYVKQGLALVGDAAHTIHPLAGQGVNLGMKDAVELANVLQAAKGQPGELKTLRQYERARRGDNVITQKAMEAFRLLFGNTITPLKFARNFGLNTVNHFVPVKNELIRKAMGIG
jgi:2-octaprenylphenol hydroxylase